MATPVASNYRAQVELPVRGICKNIWDRYQVNWLGSFDGNPFLVLAELPPGWSIKTLEITSPSTKVFKILDSSDTSLARVRIELVAQRASVKQYEGSRIVSFCTDFFRDRGDLS